VKQFWGCAIFVALLAGAGIILLKRVQLSETGPVTFKRDTPPGACQHFVRAMADRDLATMQEFADEALKGKCQRLMDQFAANVKGTPDRYEAIWSKNSHPERVIIRVVSPSGVYNLTLRVREVDGRPLVTDCQMEI
jgi:hypothetical protein